MRVCPKPLNEQSIGEVLDCGYQQALAIFGRVLQSYVSVFLAPGDARLLDWGLVLGTLGGSVVLVAKVLAQKQH